MNERLNQKIQELERQIKELRQKNLIYEKAVEAIPDGFFIVGRDGRIVEMNKTYCEHLGLVREEVIGKFVLDVIYNSKMMEIMDSRITEVDAIHRFSEGQTVTGEKLVAVSRMPVIDGGEVIAGVAMAKFSHYTIALAETLRDLEKEIEFYRKELRKHGFSSFDDLPSASLSYETAKKMAQRFADSDFPILLLGETGVGKEVFAQAIHLASSRRDGAFISVNCASIPSELLESELFGYADGAFTGGRRGGKKGKFELADGGTLFLDEIGDMPAFMQGKLLRVLQSQEVEKLGSEGSVPVNARILAATNQNLQQKVEEGTFRADLYYRLNVLPVVIPPLRDRIEDIPILTTRFLEELNERYGRKVILAPETALLMLHYAWPGNVRELRNVLGRGFMMTDDRMILPQHLPLSLVAKEKGAVEEKEMRRESHISLHEDADVVDQSLITQQEKALIIDCLQNSKGNLSKAAKALGIHRTTLYSKMESMGISIKQFRKNKRSSG